MVRADVADHDTILKKNLMTANAQMLEQLDDLHGQVHDLGTFPETVDEKIVALAQQMQILGDHLAQAKQGRNQNFRSPQFPRNWNHRSGDRSFLIFQKVSLALRTERKEMEKKDILAQDFKAVLGLRSPGRELQMMMFMSRLHHFLHLSIQEQTMIVHGSLFPCRHSK